MHSYELTSTELRSYWQRYAETHRMRPTRKANGEMNGNWSKERELLVEFMVWYLRMFRPELDTEGLIDMFLRQRAPTNPNGKPVSVAPEVTVKYEVLSVCPGCAWEKSMNELPAEYVGALPTERPHEARCPKLKH